MYGVPSPRLMKSISAFISRSVLAMRSRRSLISVPTSFETAPKELGDAGANVGHALVCQPLADGAEHVGANDRLLDRACVEQMPFVRWVAQ